MKTTLIIGLGSFIGGMARYQLSRLIQTQIAAAFPFATFTVNAIGCFLIGLVFGLTAKGNVDLNTQLFLTTGILGGFTTFSAFSLETMNLIRSGNWTIALLYVVLSIVIGLTGSVAGYSVTRL